MVYLDIRDTGVADLTPLADSPLTSLQLEGAPVIDLRPLHKTSLKMLSLIWTGEMDFKQLANIPLTRLKLMGKGLRDITALSDMKLESLALSSTSVRDLTPIAAMPLRELSLYGTPAADLTPLQNMDLTNLYLSEPDVDLAGIKDAPVFFIQIPDPATVKNFELLHSMRVRAIQAPGTKRMGAPEFWKHYDRQNQPRVSAPLPDHEAAKLIGDLDSDDKKVREKTARRLESFGPNAIAAGQPLILSLTDSEDDVVRAAVDALEAMETVAVPALLRGMNHEDPFIRHRCGLALSNIRPVASGLVTRLAKHLSDEHQRVRLYAAISLGRLGATAEPTVPDLIHTLETKDDRDVRKFAVESLGEIGSKVKAAVPPLMELLGKHPFTRVDVALGRIGPDAAAAVPILIQRYQNGNHSNSIWALGRIGPPARAAIPILTEALKSKDSKHRENARVALAMISGERPLDTQILSTANKQ